MGQYHFILNLDKKEFIHPHRLGCGLKLREQNNTFPGTANALFALLVASNGRGGGDYEEHPLIGRWVGDRIAVIGDYCEEDDVPGFDATEEFGDMEDTYDDISDLAADFLGREYDGKFEGEGWLDFKPNPGSWLDNPPGQKQMSVPDMVVRVER